MDILLKLLGENVTQYQNTEDKWIAIFVEIWGYSTYFLSYILAIIPWLWLLWRKKKNKKISKKLVAIVVIISVILFWLGYNLPWWFAELMGGLAVRSMYGGQI